VECRDRNRPFAISAPTAGRRGRGCRWLVADS
jgi:hypothetical protein